MESSIIVKVLPKSVILSQLNPFCNARTFTAKQLSVSAKQGKTHSAADETTVMFEELSSVVKRVFSNLLK